LRSSSEAVKEELCALRRELHSKEEKERRSRLELEILREREKRGPRNPVAASVVKGTDEEREREWSVRREGEAAGRRRAEPRSSREIFRRAPWREESESEEQERARPSVKLTKASQETKDKGSAPESRRRSTSLPFRSSRLRGRGFGQAEKGSDEDLTEERRGLWERRATLSDEDLEQEQEEIWEVKQRRQRERRTELATQHRQDPKPISKNPKPGRHRQAAETQDDEDSLLETEVTSVPPPCSARPQQLSVPHPQPESEEDQGEGGSVTTASGKQYDRLHKMYERITGIKGSPLP
jgi:hypothetical protein